MNVYRCTSLLCLSTLALASACDSQNPGEYRGETLAAVSGDVQNDSGTPMPNAQATLIWVNFARDGDLVVGEQVPVTGTFPAHFTLSLYQPPAEEVMMAEPGEMNSRIAVAFIAAVPPEFDLGSGSLQGPLGLSERHALLYAEGDVDAGSLTGQWLGGEIPAGYHILDVIDEADPSCAGNGFDCLRLAPADLDTLVEVRIDTLENLDAPNWF